MQLKCMKIHRDGNLKKSSLTKSLQSDRFFHRIDLKVFLMRNKRDATASAGSVT